MLRANEFPSRAHIFGNSGGATIALDLAAHHPEVVETVVGHEPPVPRVLPDLRRHTRPFYDEFGQVLADEGWQAAFRRFQEWAAHVPAGRDSLGQDPFHRSGLVIAERLGAEFAVFPGGHLAPAEIPGRFAEALRDLLARLQ